MKKKKKISILKILTIIATILAIVVSGITIYEKLKKKNDFLIEQRLSPEMMEKLEKSEGGEIKIEKGITIRREE